MSVAKAEILDAISNMSVLELSQLIKDLEDKSAFPPRPRRSRWPLLGAAVALPPRPPRRRPSSP